MRAQFVMSEIGVGLRRNLTMTFAVIISVALSLALFGGSLLMREQVSSMKGYWYDKANVSIYLCNKQDAAEAGEAAGKTGGGVASCSKGAVTDEQKKQIETELKAMSVVKAVAYESADEAYKHYQEQYGHTALASSITPDQMQESFRVKLKNPERYKSVTSAFTGRDGIYTVDDQRQQIDDLFKILNYLNYAALAIMMIMLIVALLLIVNTVRVSAFSRRRETGIMRLVGASSFYIQVPFIMEAAVAGLIGALFACAMLASGQYFVIDHGINLRDKIQLIDFLGWSAMVGKLPYVLFIGLLMPSLAAFLALRKYLKV